MSNRHPFSKHRTSPNISFRFNKFDEEVEEISTNVDEATHSCRSESKSHLNAAEAESALSNVTSLNNNENEESSCIGQKDTITVSVDKKTSSNNAKDGDQNAREQTPVKESVKDYISRIGRRAYSFDSETDGEKWPFLKDIKERIAKNLDDSKDVNKSVLKDEKDVERYVSKTTKNPSDPSISDVSSIVNSSSEVTESTGEQSLVGSSCPETEQTAKMLEKPTSVVPKKRFPLTKKKKAAPKREYNVTLSSLMANRVNSIEADTLSIQSSQNITEIPSVISSETQSAMPFLSFSRSVSVPSAKRNIFNFLLSLKWLLTSPTTIAIFACFLVPLPQVVFGFLVGAIMSISVMYWLFIPTTKKEAVQLPDYSKLPPLTIDTYELTEESTIFKGWMNELLSEYDPDSYHVNATYSVYIRLEGSHLRISHPKANIPKRAMFNEQRHDVVFIHQRHYDLTGATIDLLPKGLAMRRLWSKKYPLCLTVFDPKQTVMSGSNSSAPDNQNTKLQNPKESTPIKKLEPKRNENGEIVIFLFARTDREKDDWYRRFLKSSRLKMMKSHSPISTPNIAALENSTMENKRAVSVDLGCLQFSSSYEDIRDIDETELDDEPFSEIKLDKQLKFDYYMSQLLSAFPTESFQSKKGSNAKTVPSSTADNSSPNKANQAQTLLWLNAFIGRLFFDFLTDEFWANVVSEKIQKKLSKIKLPNFVDELKITDMNLGSALPKIHRTSIPVIDQKGIWIDLDVSYEGSFQMSLETKLNLMRLQKNKEALFSTETKEQQMVEPSVKTHVYNSEEEDTAESSSDEDVPLPDIQVNTDTVIADSGVSATSAGGSAGKKLIRFVDRIAQSSYFQHVTKNKYVKRAMAEVSNTPIVLTVEVHWLTGTLALNIPPMPSDRLWYGFRKNPCLSIVARPKLGCHTVTIAHFTEWIEKKLVLEFQKMLVMPNMDDLYIPIMQSDIGKA